MTQKRHIQIRNSIKRYWVNRKYKDRLFRKIFQDKEELLQLYNAINNTSYTNPGNLTITTLDDTIILSMKNDLSFIISSAMNLYEHQSTFNPNMPIRGVFYFPDCMRHISRSINWTFMIQSWSSFRHRSM